MESSIGECHLRYQRFSDVAWVLRNDGLVNNGMDISHWILDIDGSWLKILSAWTWMVLGYMLAKCLTLHLLPGTFTNTRVLV